MAHHQFAGMWLSENTELTLQPEDGRWVARLHIYRSEFADDASFDDEYFQHPVPHTLSKLEGITNLHITLKDPTPSGCVEKLAQLRRAMVGPLQA